MNGEGLERNDRKGVLHLTLVDRVTSLHVEHTLRRVGHRNVTTTLYIDIALLVGRELTTQPGSILDAEHQVHVDTHIGLLRNGLLGRWWGIEINKGDNIFESVSLVEGRFRHDVGDISGRQDTHKTTHGQVFR